jgi:hypothetical protein
VTATGNGTITVTTTMGETFEFKIDQVLDFANSPDCGVEQSNPFAPAPCATFTATITLNGQPAGFAEGAAFNREFFDQNNCQVFNGEGGPEVFCGSD